MTRTPRVSIGLAVYNGERFLRPTLDSILNQTFEDFELIVSDNASNDGTEKICRQYAARDARIRYSRNPVNIGLTNNFNRVFQLSRAPYFRWSSADDLFGPTSLKACIDVLDRHPEVVLCYPKTALIDADGHFLRNYEDGLDLRCAAAADRFRLALRNMGLINAHYGLIRTDVLRRTPLMGAYPGSDMVLIAALTLYGRFWEIPEQLFFRRMHDAASSALGSQPWDTVQQFWNPAIKGEVDMYYSQHRWHNLMSIVRAPIRPLEKLHLAQLVAGYAFRSRHVHTQEMLHKVGQLCRPTQRKFK